MQTDKMHELKKEMEKRDNILTLNTIKTLQRLPL